MRNLVEELRWRGLVHDLIPGTEEQLTKESTTAYIGFDPTADSLHIGSLLPIILLKHLQDFGHKPIALVGGATGKIGDPSGKSDERSLLDDNQLELNVNGIRVQLERFLDFSPTKTNAALLLNNIDWMKDFSFIDFARDVGKRITVNYMMSKDSVKNRLASSSNVGMSFTEFTYQLLQGYDFYYLYKNHNCKLQMGGSDQWGNITTGTEIIRKMEEGTEERNAFALTCPLVTKSDGSKFGKSEGGNIWLDADKTSPYAFYQFWLNQSDEDAESYIKLFTFLDQKEIAELIASHKTEPHKRLLQKKLSEELTIFVHGKQELEKAIKTSEILFSKSAGKTELDSLDEKTFLAVFDGVAQKELLISVLTKGINCLELFSTVSEFLPSLSEARRALKENSLHINKEKISSEITIDESFLINKKFILLQRGKKNYYILSFV